MCTLVVGQISCGMHTIWFSTETSLDFTYICTCTRCACAYALGYKPPVFSAKPTPPRSFESAAKAPSEALGVARVLRGAPSLLGSQICPLFPHLYLRGRASGALPHPRRRHWRPALLGEWVVHMDLGRPRNAGTRYRRAINIRLSGLHGNPARALQTQ